MILLDDNPLFINMGRKRTYSLNEDYFEIIDNKDKAYILGFIYADGSVFKNSLTIGLQEKDIKVLEFIKDKLNYGGPIYSREGYITLSISSSKLVKDLLNLGIIPNKTYESKRLPTITPELFPAFLLGFFDGDGSIYKTPRKYLYDYCVNFSCNESVLTEIKDYLLSLSITSSTIRKRYSNNIACMLDIKGSLNIEKIYNLFYNNPPSFFFERKRLRFDEFKNSLIGIKRMLTEDKLKEIANLYNQKEKQSDIARKLEMPFSSVRGAVQRLRIKGIIV